MSASPWARGGKYLGGGTTTQPSALLVMYWLSMCKHMRNLYIIDKKLNNAHLKTSRKMHMPQSSSDVYDGDKRYGEPQEYFCFDGTQNCETMFILSY